MPDVQAVMQWEGQWGTHLCDIFPENPLHQSVHEKTYTNPVEIHSTEYPVSALQKYQGHEKQGKAEKGACNGEDDWMQCGNFDSILKQKKEH